DTRLQEAEAKVVCCLARGAPKGPNLPRARLNHQDALFPGHGLTTHSQTWAKKQIFIKTSDEEVIPARQAKMQETLGSLGGRVDLTTQALKSCQRHREVESDPGQKGQLVPVMARLAPWRVQHPPYGAR
ncbi:hypothetical protein HPB47_016686, partial [Ixodes persulcatus]